MKTDAQVSKSDPNLRGLKHTKDWICLVISDFFTSENLIRWKTKKPVVFLHAWGADSETFPSFVANRNASKILSTCLVCTNSNNLTFLIERNAPAAS